MRYLLLFVLLATPLGAVTCSVGPGQRYVNIGGALKDRNARLTAGMTYTYRVVAFNSVGDSPASGTDSAAPTAGAGGGTGSGGGSGDSGGGCSNSNATIWWLLLLIPLL